MNYLDINEIILMINGISCKLPLENLPKKITNNHEVDERIFVNIGKNFKKNDEIELLIKSDEHFIQEDSLSDEFFAGNAFLFTKNEMLLGLTLLLSDHEETQFFGNEIELGYYSTKFYENQLRLKYYIDSDNLNETSSAIGFIISVKKIQIAKYLSNESYQQKCLMDLWFSADY